VSRDGAPVELALPARAESVALARLALAGVASVEGATASDTADLKLAVSEVCTCVVQALDGEKAAPMLIRYAAVDGMFAFEVEQPQVELDPEPTTSLGLAIARAVTDSLRIEGTRVLGSKLLEASD
jgi:anti-sigma regulatory factor (Ser/Thr protein kinase)